MRSYAQIVADYERTVNKTNELLASLAHLRARWWEYSVSHSTFEIIIGEPTQTPNVAIMMHWVSRLSGPTDWANQRLSISWNAGEPNNTNDFHFILADHTNDFRASGRSLRVHRDADLEFLSRDFWRFTDDISDELSEY